MKFSSLAKSSYFVVIKRGESQLLGKDCKGKVRTAREWMLLENHGINRDTQVQRVFLKKASE